MIRWSYLMCKSLENGSLPLELKNDFCKNCEDAFATQMKTVQNLFWARIKFPFPLLTIYMVFMYF